MTSELVIKIENEYAAWQTLLNSITDEQLTALMLSDNRSIKSMVAHTTAWNMRLIDAMNLIRAGQPVKPLRQPDENWSEALMRVNLDTDRYGRSQTPEQSLAAFHNSYKQVLDNMTSLIDRDLAQTTQLLTVEESLAELIFYIACEHPAEHRLEIETALKANSA